MPQDNMINTKKLLWGIAGLLFSLIVGYYGFISLDSIFLLAIVFFIAAIIGSILSIKEIIASR